MENNNANIQQQQQIIISLRRLLLFSTHWKYMQQNFHRASTGAYVISGNDNPQYNLSVVLQILYVRCYNTNLQNITRFPLLQLYATRKRNKVISRWREHIERRKRFVTVTIIFIIFKCTWFFVQINCIFFVGYPTSVIHMEYKWKLYRLSVLRGTWKIFRSKKFGV